MTVKTRSTLVMNGTEVRTLSELRDNFDGDALVGHLRDGSLVQWLEERYLDDEAVAVRALDPDDKGATVELARVFGVEIDGPDEADRDERSASPHESADGDALSADDAERAERLARLREFTDDEELLAKVDLAAFDQDDLLDRYDEGRTEIILCGDDFEIPRSKQDLTYIRLDAADDEDDDYEDRHSISLRDDGLAIGAAVLAGGAVGALLGAALGGIICAALDDDDLDLFGDCA